ncbi:MAG: Gfo/Idh/MocA family oxidoreductase [Chloroflexi bacterium]|nr:Gfo/Idh/MocA family oxidoreductase [Chloroflexota bacterium]
MKSSGIGVIGCGMMGMVIVNKLLATAEGLQVRGLFDPEARAVADALDQIQSSPTVYDTYQSLVTAPDIDWVLIASPNVYHKDQVVAAFAAGKHVFCQKPIATTLEDSVAMYDAWRASGNMFNLAYTLRYSPHYRKIKQLLEEGSLGEIISMEFNETLGWNHGGFIMGDWRRLRANAGPFLLEKCSHDIDLVNWMVGSLPKRVASFGGLNFFRPENEHHIQRLGKSEEGRDAYCTWPGQSENPFTADKDIIDNQVVILEYENGTRASFHLNCNAAIAERRMYILGSEGSLRADVLPGTIELQGIGFDMPVKDFSTGASGGHGDGDDVLVQELAESMLMNKPPGVGLLDGLISTATCFAIDEAMQSGKVVDLAPYWRQIRLAEWLELPIL